MAHLRLVSKCRCPECGEIDDEDAAANDWKCPDCEQKCILTVKKHEVNGPQHGEPTEVDIEMVRPHELVEGDYVYVGMTESRGHYLYAAIRNRGKYSLRLQGFGTWEVEADRFIDREPRG